MATNTSTDLCYICEKRYKKCTATKWCPECEEKLCEDCYGNHTVSKLLHNHGVIDIEQYRKLPTSVTAVKNICEEHDQKFTNFCQQHDKLCCPACIAVSGSHSKCTSLVLQEVIQTAKTSVQLQTVEKTLIDLKKNLQTIIDGRKSNLQNLLDQKDDILKEVKQKREKIMDHLLSLETLSDEVDKKTQKNELNLKSEITSHEERLQQVEAMINKSNMIKQYGTNLQVFISSRSLENEVAKLSNNLQEMVKNGKMKKVAITVQWNAESNDIIEEMLPSGSILEEETPIDFALTTDLGKQVTVMPTMPLENINITQKSKFNITGNVVGVRGCTFVQNKTIFVDNGNNGLIIFKETGEKEKVPTPSGSYDVTVIDDNTVAVSTNESIELINIVTNAVEKTINTGRCYGLEYYKGSLFFCVNRKGVMSVNLSSSAITAVVKDERDGGWYYCTVYNNKIYTTRSRINTVTCYTIGGDTVWEYKDPAVIDHPRGIAVDNFANVYIVSYYNNSVVVLSRDGQRHRTLLTQKDGIKSPLALHFERSKNQLLVGNERDCPGIVFIIQFQKPSSTQ